MMDNNLVIYVQVVFIFSMKIDGVQIAMSVSQCSFQLFEENRRSQEVVVAVNLVSFP